MSGLVQDSAAIWALVLVLVLPVVIIGAGEVEERLRQRDSTLTRVVTIFRSWTVPFFAVWALTRGLFGFSSENLIVRIVGTGLLLSVAAAALVVLRIVIGRVREWGDVREEGGVPQLLLALPRVGVIIVTGWLIIDTVWGVDLSAALTALGVTSLVISFALQDTLSGLASGLLLLSDAPFQPGDWIESGDVEGRVIDINWRSSRIQDRNGDLHVVPNAQLAGATVVNYYQPTRIHRVVVSLQVAYVNPPTLAKAMLLDAARSTPGVLDDPAPDVRVVQIDDPLMGYDVHLWVEDYATAPKVKADFGSLVWYMSHRHDVPLPSPAQDLYLYDGVEAGLAGIPDRAELRRRLRTSPLMEKLNEDDLDSLAGGSHAARFAAGEWIIDAEGTTSGLGVLWTGSARIVAEGPDGRTYDVAELVAGDVFGLLGRSERSQRPVRALAITDCEVVSVDQDVAQLVTSRNPALASVLNQVLNARRRRFDRMMESALEQIALAAPSDESAGTTGSAEE